MGLSTGVAMFRLRKLYARPGSGWRFLSGATNCMHMILSGAPLPGRHSLQMPNVDRVPLTFCRLYEQQRILLLFGLMSSDIHQNDCFAILVMSACLRSKKRD